MITKKKYAENYALRYSVDHNVPFKELHSHIYKSSCLAVALEYLGMLTDDDEKEYAASRGGTLIVSSPEIINGEPGCYILTMREMLDMLPETL